MTEKIRVNLASLKGNIDRFALQQIVRRPVVSYEYLVNGNWQLGQPTQKPEVTMIVFDGVDKFRAAKAAYFSWKDLMNIKAKEIPVLPEEIMQRFKKAYLNNKSLILFAPWGYRYEGEFGYREKQAMDKIDGVQQVLGDRKIPTKVLVMPADIYAKEVNGIDSACVEEYFHYVEQEAVRREYEVAYWSTIRLDNISDYEALRKSWTRKKIKQVLPAYVVDSAIIAAKRRCLKRKDPENSTYDYLTERLCEAEIIERRFQPVKLSMVSKNKDNGVDLNLPRLYMLPEKLQFPWL